MDVYENSAPIIASLNTAIGYVDFIKVTEKYASAIGFIIGISVSVLYFHRSLKLSLNNTHAIDTRVIKSVKFPTKHYLQFGAESRHKLFILNKRSINRNQGVISLKLIFLGLITAIIFSAINIVIDARTKANLIANRNTTEQELQIVMKKVELLRKLYSRKHKEIELETMRLNQKYQNNVVDDISILDARFFDIHRLLFEKIYTLQLIIINQCIQLVIRYPKGSDIVKVFIRECCLMCKNSISLNNDKKYFLQKQKHNILESFDQELLIDLQESSVNQQGHNVNKDLSGIEFVRTEDFYEFEPKQFSLKNKVSRQSTASPRSHSRNSSFLKNLELYLDYQPVLHSTPLSQKSDPFDYSQPFLEPRNLQIDTTTVTGDVNPIDPRSLLSSPVEDCSRAKANSIDRSSLDVKDQESDTKKLNDNEICLSDNQTLIQLKDFIKTKLAETNELQIMFDRITGQDILMWSEYRTLVHSQFEIGHLSTAVIGIIVAVLTIFDKCLSSARSEDQAIFKLRNQLKEDMNESGSNKDVDLLAAKFMDTVKTAETECLNQSMLNFIRIKLFSTHGDLLPRCREMVKDTMYTAFEKIFLELDEYICSDEVQTERPIEDRIRLLLVVKNHFSIFKEPIITSVWECCTNLLHLLDLSSKKAALDDQCSHNTT